jgi:hypothetical protein
VAHAWPFSMYYEVHRWLMRGHSVRAMRYTGGSLVGHSVYHEVHRWPHAG